MLFLLQVGLLLSPKWESAANLSAVYILKPRLRFKSESGSAGIGHELMVGTIWLYASSGWFCHTGSFYFAGPIRGSPPF